MRDDLSIAELLAWPRHTPLERRILLTRASGWSREAMARAPEARLSPAVIARYTDLLARRDAGEPVAYLVGEKEFYGRTFLVDPGVLIPRPETELLVDLALTLAPKQEPVRVLDVGTGSGCVAVTLKLERPAWQLSALELSAAALAVARANGARLAATVAWQAGDLRLPWPGQFDLVVANPPYIAAGDAHLCQGDVRYEPRMALTDGANGLSLLRAIVERVGAHLQPAGWVLLEHGYDQAEQVRGLLQEAAFEAVTSWPDLAGILRVTGARRPAP